MEMTTGDTWQCSTTWSTTSVSTWKKVEQEKMHWKNGTKSAEVECAEIDDEEEEEEDLNVKKDVWNEVEEPGNEMEEEIQLNDKVKQV